MNKAGASLKILRPVNCAMMVVALYVATVVAARGAVIPTQKLVAGFVTAFTLTGFAMVVNDIYDLEVDLVNEPERPLPSGTLSVSFAWYYSIVLAGFGLAFAAFDGPPELALAALSVALSFVYSSKLKMQGLAGNLSVSYNVALPFLYGGIVIGHLNAVLPTLFALALLSNTGREIIKGLSEMKGDAVRNANTVARRYGPRKGAIAGAGFALAAVALSPLPLLFGGLSPIGYAVPLAATDLLFVFLSVRLISAPERAGSIKKLYKYPMLLAMLSFLSGALI